MDRDRTKTNLDALIKQTIIRNLNRGLLYNYNLCICGRTTTNQLVFYSADLLQYSL